MSRPGRSTSPDSAGNPTGRHWSTGLCSRPVDDPGARPSIGFAQRASVYGSLPFWPWPSRPWRSVFPSRVTPRLKVSPTTPSRAWSGIHVAFCGSARPGGLSRFDGYSFRNFGAEQGLPHSCVSRSTRNTNRRVLGRHPGRAWCALIRKAAAAQTVTSGPRMFTLLGPPGANGQPVAATALHEGSDGTIWVGTTNGLFRVAPTERDTLQPVEIGLPPWPSIAKASSTSSRTLTARCGWGQAAGCIVVGLTPLRRGTQSMMGCHKQRPVRPFPGSTRTAMGGNSKRLLQLQRRLVAPTAAGESGDQGWRQHRLGVRTIRDLRPSAFSSAPTGGSTSLFRSAIRPGAISRLMVRPSGVTDHSSHRLRGRSRWEPVARDRQCRCDQGDAGRGHDLRRSGLDQVGERGLRR